jgi:protein O-mannosyl-transferase
MPWNPIPNHRNAVKHLFILIVFLILGFLLYSNTFQSPFVFDDLHNIKNNPHIRLDELTGEKIGNIFKGTSANRPFPMISFALNYYFDGNQVCGYHLVNIIIHIINGILLFYFLFSLIKLHQSDKENSSFSAVYWTAFIATLIWFTHPTHTQSVTYIVQRMNSLAALFSMISILAYLKARGINPISLCPVEADSDKGWVDSKSIRNISIAVSFLAGALAMLSKQNAVTLPFFIVLIEWYFFQDLRKDFLKRLLPWVPLLFLPGFILFVITMGGIESLINGIAGFQGSGLPFEQWLTEFRVIIHYISLLFYPNPTRLNLDYDFPFSTSLLNPATALPSVLAVLLLIVLVIVTSRKQRLFSFCLLWFLGNLAIEAVYFRELDVIFEHRLYIPSMLFFLPFVVFAFRRVKNYKVVIVVAVVITSTLSIWTWQRNEVWKSDYFLWKDNLKKSPNKARVNDNFGLSLVRKGLNEEAVIYFKKAITIDPVYLEAHFNLGNSLVNLEQLHRAEEAFREALIIDPDYIDARLNLANLLIRLNRNKEALREYELMLEQVPGFVVAHNNIGNVLWKVGKPEEAQKHLELALKIDPNYVDANMNLGRVLAGQNKPAEAAEYFGRVLILDSTHQAAMYQLGNAFFKLGKNIEAIEQYQKLLNINPHHVMAHYRLGNRFLNSGNLDQALVHYQQVIEQEPSFYEVFNNMGVVLIRQNRIKEALKSFNQALALQPGFQGAMDNREKALNLLKSRQIGNQ